MITVGIDPGVSTGICITNGPFFEVDTLKIHRALDKILEWKDFIDVVVMEDARLATYDRKSIDQKARTKGYGSIARDCKIIEDFCNDYNIPIRKTRPSKQLNALCKDEATWKRHFNINYNKRTSHHARIAAALALTQ